MAFEVGCQERYINKDKYWNMKIIILISTVALAPLFAMAQSETTDTIKAQELKLPLKAILNPSTTVTPSIEQLENCIVFHTWLCKEKGGSPVYYVDIYLFSNSSEGESEKEYNFEKVGIDYTDGNPSHWEYVKYCKDNRISYADVNNEIADKGSFRFTSYDNEKQEYSGTFTLQFSEGTMQGEFTIGH